MTAVVEGGHAANYGVYGIRRGHAELHRQGHAVARCPDGWLMKSAGVRAISRSKVPRTTVPDRGPDDTSDLVR